MTARVWDTPGTGFGDMWAALSYLLETARLCGEPQYLSRWHLTTDMEPRLREMLDLFALTPTAQVLISKERANHSMHMDCWAGRRWPSRVRWVQRSVPRDRRIAYQFDGRSSADRKNPPPEEVRAFEHWAQAQGIEATAVGTARQCMRDCALAMAQADAFVGSCSGMAHLAHSVGVPVHLVEYEHKVQWWHGVNPITIHAGLPAFLRAYESAQ